MIDPSLAFIQNLRAPKLILIFLVVLLFFGTKRLPELFRSFGKSIKEFKKATSEVEDDIRTAMEEKPKPAVRPADQQVAAGESTPPAKAEAQQPTPQEGETKTDA